MRSSVRCQDRDARKEGLVSLKDKASGPSGVMKGAIPSRLRAT